MIEAHKMMERLGKKKFTELAVHSQPKQTGAYLAHRRRWGKGKVFLAYCQHGIKIVDNYEQTNACQKCTQSVVTTGRHFGIWLIIKAARFALSIHLRKMALRRSKPYRV